MIEIQHFLIYPLFFLIGVLNFFKQKKYDYNHMSIELILLAVNINFMSFSYFLGDLTGQIFTICFDCGCCRAAIGLAILVCFFRNKGSIAVDDANVMKG